MAVVLAERVFETTTTTGTGTISLAGTVTGFQTFIQGVGDGAQVPYVIYDSTNWEVGIGTVTAGSPDTLSRDTVLQSTNSDAAVNWGSGTRNVVLSVPASLFTLAAGDNSWTGLQSFLDNKFEIKDNTDNTKKLAFQVSGITTGTTRTINMPDNDVTLGKGELLDVQVFTTSGTWNKPSGCNSIEIELVGGGGGGGGADSSASDPTSAGGGAGGTYAYKYVTSGIGSTETVTIGAGGTAGVNTGGNGGNGGATSFGSHASADGGGGGTGTGSISSGGNAYPGGLASATGSGDLVCVGQDGVNGGVSYYNALFESAQGGTGGSSKLGGGGRGGIMGNISGTFAAENGNNYGGGGGGGAVNATTAGQAGGAGAGGVVIVKSYS